MSISRRDFLKGLASVGSVQALGIDLASAQPYGQMEVVWGGTGFNVQFDEIKVKLPAVDAALEQENQRGWSAWNDGVLNSLKSNFNGEVLYGDSQKIDSQSDPGLIFSLGFDYENYIQILVPEAHLDQDAINAGLADNDISYYYLFSSIRIYSVELPRGSGGQVTLVYSKPVKAAGEDLVKKNNDLDKSRFILHTLMGDRPETTLDKFSGLASQMAISENYFDEPAHIQVRSVTYEPRAAQSFADLKLDSVFNVNLFASVTGVAVNEAFNSSVIPYVITDYLNRTLAIRFSEELEMGRIFDSMKEAELARYFIDLNVSKVLRKISAENASKQQIARGLAVDISIFDVDNQAVVFDKKLVRVEKREQVKGATEESWYRANDSIAFYELLETMLASFFSGVSTLDRKLLNDAGIRDKDASNDEIKILQGHLEKTRYGSA